MNKVLLVDTNFSSGPIYQFLIESGYAVTVVGKDPNDALAKFSKDYVCMDYSDISQMRKLIEERDFNYIIPGCNDRSYKVCAEINSDYRFPGLDTILNAEIINNKEMFRAFASKLGLASPKVLGKDEIGRRWPVIVKPVDSFSGRGVSVIDEASRDMLPHAVKVAKEESKSGTFIIEDYVQGQLFSHTAFIKSGIVVVDFIVEEHGTANPFAVDTSRVVYDFPELMFSAIREDIETLAAELKLEDGLIHTQFISNNKQYWIIEITRRCPGDLYSQLIKFSTGLNYAENYARPFVNLPFSFESRTKHNWVMRHTLTQAKKFTLGCIEFKIPLKFIKWVPLGIFGDRMRESPHGRIGIIFVEESSEKKLDSIFERTLERQLYEIKL